MKFLNHVKPQIEAESSEDEESEDEEEASEAAPGGSSQEKESPRDTAAKNKAAKAAALTVRKNNYAAIAKDREMDLFLREVRLRGSTHSVSNYECSPRHVVVDRASIGTLSGG